MPLNIIFEDSYLLVVDKPPGLVSTPSETQTDPTLADILNQEYHISLERGGLVHRLDKDTSGLIIAAKNQAIFDNLQAQFKERRVQKEYIALIHGRVEEETEVNAPIARNPGDREKFVVLADGRDAVTSLHLLQVYTMPETSINQLFGGFNKIQMRRIFAGKYPEFSLVRCFPKTGRTHQIRVHLKYINHPIVGDEKYGGRKTVRLDHRWCPRQFLHAAKITFEHPITGQVLNLASPLASDLQVALDYLKAE